MSPNLSTALHGLRDVDEVQGSFLVAGDGQLLARDLPPVFNAELFAEVGPRLARLREMFDAGGTQPSTLTLRFSEHKLHVRSLGPALLCVLSGAKVNAPALRMAINLVVRRFEALGVRGAMLLDESPTPPTLRQTLPPPAASTAPPGPVSSRKDVLYRGRRL